MKELIVLIILVVILAGFLLSNIDDTSASATDTDVPDNKLINNPSKADASNSSASATITIRMTTAPLLGD